MLAREGQLLKRKCLSRSPFVAMMKTSNFGKFYHRTLSTRKTSGNADYEAAVQRGSKTESVRESIGPAPQGGSPASLAPSDANFTFVFCDRPEELGLSGHSDVAVMQPADNWDGSHATRRGHGFRLVV